MAGRRAARAGLPEPAAPTLRALERVPVPVPVPVPARQRLVQQPGLRPEREPGLQPEPERLLARSLGQRTAKAGSSRRRRAFASQSYFQSSLSCFLLSVSTKFERCADRHTRRLCQCTPVYIVPYEQGVSCDVIPQSKSMTEVFPNQLSGHPSPIAVLTSIPVSVPIGVLIEFSARLGCLQLSRTAARSGAFQCSNATSGQGGEDLLRIRNPAEDAALGLDHT